MLFISIQESSAEDEDLEKKLRERALNSMKKKAAKEARNETDESSSDWKHEELRNKNKLLSLVIMSL